MITQPSIQTLQLVELKALPPLSNMLTVQDPRTVTVALDGIHNILTAASKVITRNNDTWVISNQLSYN